MLNSSVSAKRKIFRVSGGSTEISERQAGVETSQYSDRNGFGFIFVPIEYGYDH
jgi:hypothetical protein